MTDEKAVVIWSVSGLPPAYTERRSRADVPSALRPAFDGLLERAHFFELPADMGPNNPDGRDMGSYGITVTIGSRSHIVRFSDSTATQELADLRNWVQANLALTATLE
jgi:emfourin